MAVKAMNEYVGVERDAVENFHGNQVVYVDWDKHRLFCAALAFPLPPAMPFAALIKEVIPPAWGNHPQFSDIDWNSVQWILDDQEFTPKLDASLADNGVGHKSLLRFITPGLEEYTDNNS